MSRPRLTIGLPVKDGEAFLARALDSLLAQSFGDFELLVADNASADGTEEIALACAARDPRVRYVRHDRDLGAAANFNHVARAAAGELFKWAAHDDECAPDFLADCIAALDAAGPDTVLAFPRTRWIDAAGGLLADDEPLPWDGRRPSSRLASLWRDPRATYLTKCSPVCGVIRTRVLLDTRLVQPHASADKVTLVELALRGDWARVAAPHFLRRVHDGSSLAANKGAEDVARWFDPTAAGPPLTRARLFHGYRKAVARAPLGPSERLRCRTELLRLLGREWRVIGGEYKRALRTRPGKTG